MTVADRMRMLRERSEYELRMAAMEDVGRRFPEATVRKPASPRGGMTSQGWNAERRWQEPWRPPRS